MKLGVSAGGSRVPKYLVGFAALLAATLVGESVVRAVGWIDWSSGDPLVFTGEFLIGAATTLPFVAGIGYAGYWLPRSRLEAARYPRILRWVLGTAVASLLFNAMLVAVIGATSVGMFVAWMRWSVAVGGGLGIAVGVSEARAVQSSVETARAESRARHAASQRDLLDYLNGLLRHEILNATQVISGNAELLVDEHEPGSLAHDRGETIRRQSEDVTDVIQNVRRLLNATREDAPLEPVNAAALLVGRIETLESRHEDIRIDASITETAFVRANPLLERVFGNLLTNAVEHNDGDTATVRVRMTVSPETVTVTVADDGPGIPDDVTATLFDRPDSFDTDHGFGLYLTEKLVEQHRGTLELVETGPDGTRFRVELPRARPGSVGEPADAADPRPDAAPDEPPSAE
ncbi:sensor histidine kinase [Halosimplex pelagicum]|uniref:histidine kinase n=1 Tax=Halosimplex pelagicum TaxID=869886 RepID=A0A7D5PB69_9EURY|nr:HAMP domain-containing sensor histidine kinase [Halosimplex pelagicum]QLH81578.1 HAMP domain-containing histidine kinase [Halosimplex pelagicum]